MTSPGPSPRTPRNGGALCPVTETIRIIGKKWYLIILHELTKGPRGFNDLRRGVGGISAKVLSESLRHLEERSLVNRRVHNESPIRVEYSLTPQGAELEQLFYTMRAWGEKWGVCQDAEAARTKPAAHEASASVEEAPRPAHGMALPQRPSAGLPPHGPQPTWHGAWQRP